MKSTIWWFFRNAPRNERQRWCFARYFVWWLHLGGAIAGWMEKFGLLPQKLTAKALEKTMWLEDDPASFWKGPFFRGKEIDIFGGWIFSPFFSAKMTGEFGMGCDFLLVIEEVGKKVQNPTVLTPKKTQRLGPEKSIGPRFRGQRVNDEGLFAVQPFVFRCRFGGENDSN